MSDLVCYACGKRFRSAIAEAKHRHNFPTMCTRNTRFAKFVADTERARQTAQITTTP